MFQANGSRSLSGGGESDGGVVGNGERGSGDEFMVVDHRSSSSFRPQGVLPNFRLLRAAPLAGHVDWICVHLPPDLKASSCKSSGLVLDHRFVNISTNRVIIAP